MLHSVVLSVCLRLRVRVPPMHVCAYRRPYKCTQNAVQNFHVNFWAQRKSYRCAHSVLLLSEDQYRARLKEILKSSHTFLKSSGGTPGKRVFARDFSRSTADSTALAGYHTFYPGKLPLWPTSTTKIYLWNIFYKNLFYIWNILYKNIFHKLLNLGVTAWNVGKSYYAKWSMAYLDLHFPVRMHRGGLKVLGGWILDPALPSDAASSHWSNWHHFRIQLYL